MASTGKKFYQEGGFDDKHYLCTYFSPDCSDPKMFKEVVTFPTEEIKRCCDAGDVKGDVLIDFSSGPIFFHLFPCVDKFKKIIILEFNDSCITEMEKWMKADDEAFDWSHISSCFPEVGTDNALWKEKEEALKKKVCNVWKFDLEKKNPVEPNTLPKAECLVSMYLFQQVSKDKEDFSRVLGKLAAFIKVGGLLLLIGAFNKLYLKIGEETIHCLTYDEAFLRKSLQDLGFTIESLRKTEGKMSNEFTVYDNIYFVSARKVREVEAE